MTERDTHKASVSDAPEQSRFEIRVDGQLAGYAQYRRRPGRVVFTHTEIAPGYQGRGLAARLAREALDAVRAEGSVVTPLCPYIAGYIQKHPDYVGLVDAEYRAHFASPET
jgi:predicted GNAT family acetyltransferase